jgi:hypothetical protein
MNPTYDRAKSSGKTPNEAIQPIRFAGSVLEARRHVCAFFHDADEEYRVLLPFIKDGFEQGERAFHIVDPNLRAGPRWREAARVCAHPACCTHGMGARRSAGRRRLSGIRDAT